MWALLLALLLPVIYILPSGFIYAMTGQGVRCPSFAVFVYELLTARIDHIERPCANHSWNVAPWESTGEHGNTFFAWK